MRTAMYLRKSRAEENEPTTATLSRHRDILTAFATAQDLRILHIYEEVASGDSLHGRPQMLALLSRLAEYEAVLCMDIDRLGRGAMQEQGLILESFRSANLLIITPAKTYDLNDDADDSLIGFKALFAREEYKIIRSRLRRGTLKAVEEGCYLSNAPFGYRQIRNGKKPTLEPVPQEAEGVRLIFSLYCQGKGCQHIADTLHTLGYRPRRGEQFHRTTISKILQNPVYTGQVVWNQYTHKRPKNHVEKHKKLRKDPSEWLVVPGLHPAIVPLDLFQEANQKRRERYTPPSNRSSLVQNPFAGILYCGVCNKSMTRLPLSGKPYSRPLLACTTAGCTMSSTLDAVERLLYQHLYVLFANVAPKPYEAPAAAAPQIADTARMELSRLKQQSARLHDLLEQGIYNASTFALRRKELTLRMQKTQELLTAESQTVIPAHTPKPMTHILEEYWNASPAQRNQMLKTLIRRIEYRKPKGSPRGSLPALTITAWRQ